MPLYHGMETHAGKPPQVAVVAVTRKLFGFVWGIVRQIAKKRAALKAA